ncbi:bifunctional diguanylate cyclase/phosphodiesterase [Conexibacter sp. SYSU D00693]|uniref:putative bifunctional diguanylate cyclase/phosphodiesterase n=1 Tax=Conexibacter sp. SYSU D00693 TaxID=2812560 RepID=UPI00196AC402|nr:EAL domain-containing protein [Conexibacter sp. SYSU D00693]
MERRTLTVLTIEDHAGFAHLLRRQLEADPRTAFVVRHAPTLAEGVEDLALHQADCVLLDLTLPDAEGLQALEVLRSVAFDLPVVVLSGRADEDLAMQAVQEGAQDYLVKGEADGRLIARACQYAVERKRSELQLAHQALHDGLTGLPNRALLLDRLAQAVARTGRRDGSVAVLFCDLDRFKVVNDSLGHSAGDDLLVQVAHRLRSALRLGDTAARFGGDEFVVLCEDLDGPEQAQALATRITSALRAPFRLDGAEVPVRVSVGIALCDGPTVRPETLLRDADAAMYRAKERGGGRLELFDRAMHDRAVRRLEVETSLHRAIERDELELHFQPQVALPRGGVCGAEALVRWRHPERGLVPPSEFIPAAEETGLVYDLGAWVFERACRQWVAWGGPELEVAVNLSAHQCQRTDLPELFAHTLRRTGADPRRICLEVTETAVMGDQDTAGTVLGELKALGLGLAIDDFGTGWSSLSALQRFPFDLVKIDRSFVAALGPQGGEDGSIVTAIVSLSHALGMQVVAEGVETDGQRRRLADLGCDVGQGYLFARPAPAGAAPPAIAV